MSGGRKYLVIFILTFCFAWASTLRGQSDRALVADIVDPKFTILERLNWLHALGKNLTERDVDTLLTFIGSQPSGQEGNLAGVQVLKNDLMDVLREQEIPNLRFPTTLIKLYRGTDEDFVTRDYAIQHLILWYEKTKKGAVATKEEVRRTLNEALLETNSIAGTALMGMHRLSEGDGDFNSREIDSAALNYAKSPKSDLASRVTAIQVCAERNLKAALPVAEALAQTESNISLRISALAAIGKLGGKEHALFLQQLKAENNPELRAAIAAALKALKDRMSLY